MKPPSFQRDDTVLQSLPSFESKFGPGVSIAETPVAKVVTQSMGVENRDHEFEGLDSISLVSQTRSRKSLVIIVVVLLSTLVGVISFLLTNTSESDKEELIGPTQQPTTITELNAELCAVVQSEAPIVFFCEAVTHSSQCLVATGVMLPVNPVCNPLESRFCSCPPGKFAEVPCPQISDCQDIEFN